MFLALRIRKQSCQCVVLNILTQIVYNLQPKPHKITGNL
jgi:hypothetical protein